MRPNVAARIPPNPRAPCGRGGSRGRRDEEDRPEAPQLGDRRRVEHAELDEEWHAAERDEEHAPPEKSPIDAHATDSRSEPVRSRPIVVPRGRTAPDPLYPAANRCATLGSHRASQPRTAHGRPDRIDRRHAQGGSL
jgi:hypothetical protein